MTFQLNTELMGKCEMVSEDRLDDFPAKLISDIQGRWIQEGSRCVPIVSDLRCVHSILRPF